MDRVEKLKEAHRTLEARMRERTRELEQANAKDEAILTSVGDGLVVTGKDGNIVLTNRAFANIMGWKNSEVEGKLLAKLVLITDEKGKPTADSEHPVAKTLREHVLNTRITYYRRRDGTSFPVITTVSPVLIEKEFIGAVEVFRDITKEKEVDRAKTEFVSLASHQLRTPLATISWYTEMLLGGDAGEITADQKKYLEEIYTGNQRMVELVNSLLNVSRLELGTFMVEPELTDVSKLAGSVIDEQKPQIAERKIEISSSFEKNVPLIQADPKLLRMVMQNLLSNAVKYTPEGGKIELALSLDQEKKNVLLAVSDTGYGIPKNQQDRIFTKLFRADNVRGKETEGTGLGLYIVKSIIEHSGGKVWFESAENKGTTFYLTLPLAGMKKKEGTRALEIIN